MRKRTLNLEKSIFFLSFLLLSLASSCTSAKNLSIHSTSQHQEWLNLLHYSKEGYLTESYRSYVDDNKFFFSQQGVNNPKAELLATIAEFHKPASSKDSNSHAICRFPARLQWLTSQSLIDPTQLPNVNCSNFKIWYAEMNADSLTLIFAAAYLNSPSSMFGHTLIRLDNSQLGNDANWLSYAVNFGADTNNNDNSISFAYKGITGGYQGFFHIMPFYKKIQEYSFMENRELWEYQLNLSAIETKRLILHLWELRDINFAYYYVTENCSFRLLELLQIARPGTQLTAPFKHVTIPSDIIQTVVEHDFVKSIHYRLPQAKQLGYQVAEIDQDFYPIIEQLTSNETPLSKTFKQLPLKIQRKLVDTAYQLLRHQTLESSRNSVISTTKLKLLKQLNSFPKKTEPVPQRPIPFSPDQGHHSRLVNLAIGHESNKFYSQFSYRQNYHDLLDNPKGFFSGAEINFFDLDLRLYDNRQIKLQKFKILNITSLSPRNHFVKPVSWHLDTGVEYQNYKTDKLSAFVNAGAGVSYNLFKNSLTYGFIDAHLEYNPAFKYNVEPGTGLQIGQLYESDLGSSQLKFDSKIFIDGNYLYSMGFKHNLPLETNHALRFSIKKSWNKRGEFENIELAYRYYF